MQLNSPKVYQQSTMSARKNVPLKPYCKVCHDTGKPESIYRSHYVKTAPGPNGVIVCPTLANLECRYCHQKGHTVKHCTVLEERKKQEEKEAKRKEKKQEPAAIKEKVITTEIINNNMYAYLQDEDDEPTIQQPEPSIQEPEPAPVAMSYACALVKPAPIQEEETQTTKYEPVVKPVPAPVSAFNRLRMKNWADWTDSEDEEDLKF